VTHSHAGYTKTWLVHHANEPVVDGGTWRSDQDRGRIFVRTLLPEDATLEKVGGPGREFMADGVNYAIDAGPSKLIVENKYPIGRMHYKEIPELMGRWRMEVRPGSARKEDLFLHLIQVGDQSICSMSDAKATVTGDNVELSFSDFDGEVFVSFAARGESGGRISRVRHGETVVEKDLVRDVQAQEGLAVPDQVRSGSAK